MRTLETYRFGPHRAQVVEAMDDDGAVGYRVVVDDIVVTDPPLASEPSLDDVVRIYADWLAQSH